MMERPADRRQLDLLVRAANALEPNRIPPPIRAEVTFLLTLLMAEYLAANTAPPAAQPIVPLAKCTSVAPLDNSTYFPANCNASLTTYGVEPIGHLVKVDRLGPAPLAPRCCWRIALAWQSAARSGV